MVYLPLEKNIQYLGWLVLVHLEQVVSQDLLEHPEQVVSQDLLEHPVHPVQVVFQDLLELQVQADLQDQVDQVV